jgi:chorismate lyase/3-hydroxybenzoate synthase
LSAPPPPGWVEALLGGLSRPEVQKAGDGTEVEIRASSEFALLRVTEPGADALGDEALQRAVARAYVAIAEVEAERGWHALRVWNFVPGIRRPARAAGSRYELFNAGRRSAWLQRGRGRPAARLPAASAVDAHGEDLVIEALVGSAPGRPVENPRQIPAYRYSSRYGAQPPWFSRATLLPRNPLGGRGRLALVSGTASVRGEDTQHPGDLAAQIEETLRNLASLAAALASPPHPAPAEPAQAAPADLARYRWLRAYVVREADAPAVLERVAARFGALEALELVVADLCRSDLLLEIEGTAVADR